MPLSGGTSFPPEASPNSLIAEKDSALVVVGQLVPLSALPKLRAIGSALEVAILAQAL